MSLGAFSVSVGETDEGYQPATTVLSAEDDVKQCAKRLGNLAPRPKERLARGAGAPGLDVGAGM
jgi:hypothetical protein